MSKTKEDDLSRKDKAIAPALVSTIADKGAIDLVSDYSELALDGLLSDGPLKDVPVIGTVIKIAKVGIGVRDHVFLKKVASFLRPLKDISDHERDNFRSRIEADEEFSSTVGEKLILLLERADDMKKPALIGKAFAAYLRKELDFEQFTRMAAGIDRALMPDLAKLSSINNLTMDKPWAANLAHSGLVRMGWITPMGGVTYVCYSLSDIGELVLETCLS